MAVHVLSMLALGDGEPATSAFIAASVKTNPVVIRRILGELRRLGLVRSQSGAGGGWELATDPDAITLAQLRHAVEKEGLFELHRRRPNPRCPVGRSIQCSGGFSIP